MIVDRSTNKPTIGAYLIEGIHNGTQFGLIKKPNWFRILCARLFLGWKWVSISQLKKLNK